MIREHQNKANLFILLGFGLSIAGAVMGGGSEEGSGAGLFIQFVGGVLFIFGCQHYALGKGHSGWLGLLGLLSLIGLVILVFLPDKNKGGAPDPTEVFD